MVGKDSHGGADGIGRRGFLGGVTGVLAATAYSLEVPEGVAAQVTSGDDSDVQHVESPDGSIEVTVDVSSGVPRYSVAFEGTTYVDPSPVGFSFANQDTFGTGIGGSGPAMTVTGSEHGTGTEAWTPEWGAYDSVSAAYNYLTLGLEETSGPGRSANLRVRVFDDGLGFQVVFDDDFGDFAITSENTEFDFADDYTAWWIRNEFVNPRFEQEYTESRLSEIDAGSRTIRPNDNTVRTGAHTPLTMRADDGTYLSVHEANLDDYATMSLAAVDDDGSERMAAELAPLPDGTKVRASAPHATPWRTFQVGTSPGDLVESQLVPLLAPDRDDSVLPTTADGSVDTDWIAPRKYVGVWWTMIAGSANWEYKTDQEVANDGNDPAAYVHGARTERTKRYMRFAGEHGLDSVLVEGWNQGWDTYPGDGTGLEMGVADSYPDFDVGTVTDYGATLPTPVELTIHNETAGNVVNYEDEIENADVFAGYESEGIRSIKNGYVSDPGLGFEGDGSTASHNHHCQTAVNHHRLAIREAARNRQMLEIHEGIKPTGEVRTYPNVACREVVTAQEYDGFDALASDVGRDHHVLLPFTRMLAGPTSYQPGIFDLTFNDDTGGRVQTTLAKQLAMYPTYLGGLQMVADRIEAYVDPSLSVGEFVHAAAGRLDGMVTADEWRDALGAHYVPVDPNREPPGSSVEFRVEVPEAGDYDLHLRYAADEEDNAKRVGKNGGPRATLVVDGSRRTIEPPYTDYWDDWDVFTTTVSLPAGTSTVALELDYDDSGKFEGDVGGFNCNAVGVSEVGADPPVPAAYGDVDPALENYDAVPAFDFVEDVPADWDDTVVADAEIGDYVATARRSGEEWYVGAMTGDAGRNVDVSLDFLSPQSDGWVLELYADDAGTDVETDPESVRITESVVAAGDTVQASMARGGGTAMRLRPATAGEAADLPAYERPPTEVSYEFRTDPDPGERFITAVGTNDTDHVGGETVAVYVDGEYDSRQNLRFAPGATDETVQFPTTIEQSGVYEVQLRDEVTGGVITTREVAVGDVVARFDDPTGDDDGPGAYVYPTADAFRDGAFDLVGFEVYETDSAYDFVFEVANLYDAFDSGNFSPHFFVVWLRDPSLSGGTTTENGDLDVVAGFEDSWHYRVAASGFDTGVIDAGGTDLGSPGLSVDLAENTVTVSVDKGAMDDVAINDSAVVPVVGSEDYGTFRNVAVDATDWEFGGATSGADYNAPRVIDLVTPEGASQSDALAYDGTTLASLPFTSL